MNTITLLPFNCTIVSFHQWLVFNTKEVVFFSTNDGVFLISPLVSKMDKGLFLTTYKVFRSPPFPPELDKEILATDSSYLIRNSPVDLLKSVEEGINESTCFLQVDPAIVFYVNQIQDTGESRIEVTVEYLDLHPINSYLIRIIGKLASNWPEVKPKDGRPIPLLTEEDQFRLC